MSEHPLGTWRYLLAWLGMWLFIYALIGAFAWAAVAAVGELLGLGLRWTIE